MAQNSLLARIGYSLIARERIPFVAYKSIGSDLLTLLMLQRRSFDALSVIRSPEKSSPKNELIAAECDTSAPGTVGLLRRNPHLSKHEIHQR